MELISKSGYFVMNFNPSFVSPDEGFDRFTPADRYVTVYADSDVYDESLDENGFKTSARTKDYTFSEIFANQVEIFRQYPIILTK